jgi:TPR repeat protein
MSIRNLMLALSLCGGLSANAQHCSGGANGGMDATGNDCNEPAAAVESDAVRANRRDAMAAYRIGDFKRAAALFQVAAEQGDQRSAETLALMHRYGPSVFGAGFVADAKMARYWATKAAEAKARTRIALTSD